MLIVLLSQGIKILLTFKVSYSVKMTMYMGNFLFLLIITLAIQNFFELIFNFFI